MAVTTKEQILAQLKAKFGDDTTDETLKIIEDVSDTFDDLSKKPDSNVDWQAKYEENDKMWREKYRDRFFNSPADEDADGSDPANNENPAPEEGVKKNYEDLFREVK